MLKVSHQYLLKGSYKDCRSKSLQNFYNTSDIMDEDEKGQGGGGSPGWCLRLFVKRLHLPFKHDLIAVLFKRAVK